MLIGSYLYFIVYSGSVCTFCWCAQLANTLMGDDYAMVVLVHVCYFWRAHGSGMSGGGSRIVDTELTNLEKALKAKNRAERGHGRAG